MPQTDTKRGQVILNTLTKAEYDSASKNATQLYGLKDTHELYLGSTALSRNTAYEAATDCVTFIPQDIILELSGGTLTLKAGSKLYFPNGSGVFDAATIPTDKTYSYTVGTSTRMLFYNRNAYNLNSGVVSDCFSGSTAPSTSSSSTIFWYDTSSNLIKRSDDGGSTWSASQQSLPIAIVQVTSGSITSIEKVFNGFGFIGSSIIVLPGVRGIYPDGRNADGTMKNTEVTVQNVLVGTATDPSTRYLMVASTSVNGFISVQYNADKNILYNWENSQIKRVVCGKYTRDSNGQVVSFNPKAVFRATDYYETQQLADSVDSLRSSLSSDAMMLTGTQTAAGAKTFSDFIRFNGGAARVTTWKADVTPQSNQWCDFQFRDNTDTWFGTVGLQKKTNGDLVTHLQARKQDGSSNYGNIEIGFTANGQLFTSAPTPPASANSTEIVTAEWIGNRIATTRPTANSSASASKPDSVIKNYYNSGNGYWGIKFSSGLIMQGGRRNVSLDSNEVTTVTFPIPFSDALKYCVVAMAHMTSGHSGFRCMALAYGKDAKKTSSVDLYNDGEDIPGFEWVAFGY